MTRTKRNEYGLGQGLSINKIRYLSYNVPDQKYCPMKSKVGICVVIGFIALFSLHCDVLEPDRITVHVSVNVEVIDLEENPVEELAVEISVVYTDPQSNGIEERSINDTKITGSNGVAVMDCSIRLWKDQHIEACVKIEGSDMDCQNLEWETVRHGYVLDEETMEGWAAGHSGDYYWNPKFELQFSGN